MELRMLSVLVINNSNKTLTNKIFHLTLQAHTLTNQKPRRPAIYPEP